MLLFFLVLSIVLFAAMMVKVWVIVTEYCFSQFYCTIRRSSYVLKLFGLDLTEVYYTNELSRMELN